MYDAEKYNGKIIIRDNKDKIGIRSLRFSQLVDELFEPAQTEEEINFIASYIIGKIASEADKKKEEII